MIAIVHHNLEDAERLKFVISEVAASFPIGDHPVAKKGPMVLERVA